MSRLAQLFFRYGAMNSGKTIEILKVAHNYEEQDKSVIILTSGLDNRDGVGLNVKQRQYLMIPIFLRSLNKRIRMLRAF